MKHSKAYQAGDGRAVRGRSEATRTGKRRAMEELPPVVYAARLKDGCIKIGWSASLYRRLERLGGGTEILAFRPGTRDDEAAIHASLIAHRARGHEYYHETPDVMAIVNDMRRDLGLPLLAA